MVPDSSSTAFAMYTGVKTSGYTMGYDYSVSYMNISSQENATEVTTVLDWAQERGQLLKASSSRHCDMNVISAMCI